MTYHVVHHVYEYQYAARPVSFADGHAELVPSGKLAATLAASNAARTTL